MLRKPTQKEIFVLVAFVIFLILVTIPVYKPRNGCEVARPGYECASAKDIMMENCKYWAKYNCNTSADVSLPQVVWYIENLCKIANELHDYGYECSNPKIACNQAAGREICPLGS